MMATPEALEELLKLPQVAPLHPAPLSVQVTPPFCESLLTEAVKFWLPMSACTLTLLAFAGEVIVTEMAAVGGGVVPVGLRAHPATARGARKASSFAQSFRRRL
jgi:hypothetical protein